MIASAALDRQSALCGGGEHLDGVEQFGRLGDAAQPPQPGRGDDHRVELTRRDLAHAGVDVAPDRDDVDTRVRKVATGELDAVVVAAAGLRRLGRITEATELLDPLQMLPAPPQGALAIECRAARS